VTGPAQQGSFEPTPQGTRYYGRRAQIGNAGRISPFQGFVEAAKALQKCRRLCPSGWARRRSRGLRLRHLHESSSFGAAVHRASKARTARIGIVKSRYQSTKRRPQLEGLLSGGAACPARGHEGLKGVHSGGSIVAHSRGEERAKLASTLVVEFSGRSAV
jgi:hypothetical protein